MKKKNPLFYSRTNANMGKIARARKILGLSLLCLFSVFFMTGISLQNSTSGKSIATSASASVGLALFAPFAIGQKGKKDVNGDDESEEDFLARKGAAETTEHFLGRLLTFKISDAISKANDEWAEKYKELQKKVDASKSADDFKKLETELEKHGLDMKALKESVKVGEDRSIKKGSIREILEKNKERIQAFTKSKSGTLLIEDNEYQTKASTTSTDITGRDYITQFHEGGAIGQIPVRQPFMRELFRAQAADKEYVSYIDQDTVVRDAKNVALCAASTSNTKVTFKKYAIKSTKVRDFTHVCLDMMDDYSFVGGEVNKLIDSSLALKIDTQLISGTGVDPELNSFDLAASVWAPNIPNITDWTGMIQAPNLANLIAVAKSQIRELGQLNAWNPNFALVNPGDHEALMHLKNNQNDTLRFYPGMFVDTGGNIWINGVRLIQNPIVTQDTFRIGDFSKGTVYTRPGIGIEMSYENGTNFELEMVTVKAYERMNLLIRNVDKNAFMTCTGIQAALAAIKM